MILRDYRYFYHKIGDHDVRLSISEMDESGTTNYFGFLGDGGCWIILAYDTSANTFRYAVGTELYTVNWAARAALTYKYFNQIT